MDLLEALSTRRSIRSFTDDEVSDDFVQEIINAGLIGPSANNQQPWAFVVVRDDKTRAALVELVKQAHFIHFTRARKAAPMTEDEARERVAKVFATYSNVPVWIVAFRVPRDYMNEGYKDVERDADRQGAAAAFYAMLLRARSLDLATVWTHTPIYLEKELKELLNAPEEAEFLALTPVAHPQKWPETSPAHRPVEEVVFRDRF